MRSSSRRGSGRSVRQRSVACAQRVLKTQPGGGASGEGSSPLSTMRSARQRAGRGCQQRLGVGVQRPGEDARLGALLDRVAQVHHQHLVRDVAHHAEVVRDEEIGQAELGLQVVQQVQHLGLDRHVERRHRLVGHQQARVEHQGPRDRDALALAAGEHVRIAVGVLGPQADPGQHVARLGGPLGLAGGRC